MSFTGGKGGSKSKSSQTQKLDPRLESALYGNLADTQSWASGNPYRPLSGTMIESYRNPYTQAVTDTTINDLERSRQIAQVNNDAAATKAGAFGGSRHGILGAQTNAEYDRNTAAVLAGINEKSYAQALEAAAAENNNQNQYGLALRQLINQSLGLIPSYGTTTGTQKGSDWNLGFSFAPKLPGVP